MHHAVDRDGTHMNQSLTNELVTRSLWLRSGAPRRLLGLIIMGSTFFVGCGSPSSTEVDEDPHNLMVWGYVMARGFPAEGGVGLMDSAGVVVVTTPVRGGRYLIGLRLPPNTPICDRYRVQVAVDVGNGAVERDERLLQKGSGECVLPPGEKVTHTIDFSVLEDSTSSAGRTK